MTLSPARRGCSQVIDFIAVAVRSDRSRRGVSVGCKLLILLPSRCGAAHPPYPLYTLPLSYQREAGRKTRGLPERKYLDRR